MNNEENKYIEDEKKENTINEIENDAINKKKNILLRMCIWLSIIPSILSIIGAIGSFNSVGFARLGALLPYFFIPSLLIYIWGFYFIVTITKYLYKMKKIYAGIFLVLVVLLLGSNSIKQKLNPQKYDLSKVFQYIYYDKKDFLIYNNRLYYNVHEFNNSTNMINMMFEFLFDNVVAQDSINSMNFDETDNKVLCNNLKNDVYIGDKYFHFVKNNELYYSDVYDGLNGDSNNRRINLSNCKITKLIDDYRYIRNTGDNNTVFMYKVDVGIDSSTSVIKYDISQNKIIKSIDISKAYDYNRFIIDYSNFNIYYIDTNYDNGEFSYLHMNDKLLFTTKGYDLELLLFTNNYLFLYDDNNIYKFDLTNNKIMNTIENKFKKISRIFSDTNDNYFMADNKIYKYNEEKNEFEDVLNRTINNEYYNVYHYGDKILFDNNSNDILIFDANLKSIKEYEDILYNYDNDMLYIIYKNRDNDKITIDKIK